MGVVQNFENRVTEISFAASRINIGTFLFLLFLFLLSSFWIQTTSFGLAESWAQTYTTLSTNVILPLFIITILLGIWLSGGAHRNMRFPFVPFISKRISIPQVILISLILGSVFFLSGLQVPVRNQAIAIFEDVPTDITNQFNAFVTVMNFAFVPALNEEIFWFLSFISINIFLTKMLNPKKNPDTQFWIFMLAFTASLLAFSGWHYDKAVTEIEFDYKTYLQDPEGWMQNNPTRDIPPNPRSAEALQPFVFSLLWLFFFKAMNSSTALFFGSFWIAVLTHFINNAAQLITVSTYGLGALAIPHVLLIFAIFILLIFLQRRLVE